MAFKELDTLLQLPVYSPRQEKATRLISTLREVTIHHYANCKPYQTLCDKRGFNPESFSSLEELPYLPTSIFKDALLISVPEEAVFREIRSSATSTGRSSRVGLDKATSRRQTKCFNKVVMDRIGNERSRFIVLDEPSSIGRGDVVSARSSTIRSLLIMAKDPKTCVAEEDGKLRLEEDKLDELLRDAERTDEKVVIFGFTFILYAYVVRPLLKSGRRYTLPGSKVLHIGGWKKLETEKVTQDRLNADCSEVFGVSKRDIVDFYGFTEQSGLIYPTCEEGVRHSPVWAEVIVRDPLSLKPLPEGQEGLLQFITPIQTSYPGHSVLTEDLGFITGVDDCPCGRMGTTFKMTGRAASAEVRGCGDIMSEKFA
jgi:hypothetical protein